MKQETLPVPPHVVAKVVKIAANPDSSAVDIAEVIKTDPVLSTQVLKSVNSAYYALRKKVSSVERAVSFMGMRAVRNLVLCLGVRELAPGKSNYPLEVFWECSLRRASAAKLLARRLKAGDEDEFFTLGLCQDLGVLALLRQGSEELLEELAVVVRKPANVRLEIEKKHGESHYDLGAQMFEKWEFADDIIQAVKWHHDVENAPEEHALKAKIIFVGEAISDLMTTEDKHHALEHVQSVLEDLGISEDEVSDLVEEAGEMVTSAAEMLEMKVGPQPSYAEIAQQASEGLLALNMDYESLTEKLQSSLSEQQKMANKLQELNRELEQRALTDELTGLPNRRAFDEGLEREIERAKRLKQPLSLLMLDVDKFKVFNDTHGHQAGDRVLAEVGQVIGTNARGCDIPARYGGEEFAVILPHTPLDGAKIAAERFRKCIEDLSIQFEGKTLRVTASIGVAVLKKPERPRAGIMVIRDADDALYAAKEEGRNCVIGSDDI